MDQAAGLLDTMTLAVLGIPPPQAQVKGILVVPVVGMVALEVVGRVLSVTPDSPIMVVRAGQELHRQLQVLLFFVLAGAEVGVIYLVGLEVMAGLAEAGLEHLLI